MCKGLHRRPPTRAAHADAVTIACHCHHNHSCCVAATTGQPKTTAIGIRHCDFGCDSRQGACAFNLDHWLLDPRTPHQIVWYSNSTKLVPAVSTVPRLKKKTGLPYALSMYSRDESRLFVLSDTYSRLFTLSDIPSHLHSDTSDTYSMCATYILLYIFGISLHLHLHPRLQPPSRRGWSTTRRMTSCRGR